MLTRSGDPTGVYFVRPHASGRNFTYARRGSAASLYRPEDLPEQAISDAKVLHASGISQAISPEMRAAVRRGAELARAYGTLFSFDINLRLKMWSLEDARAAAAEILPLASHHKIMGSATPKARGNAELGVSPHKDHSN